MEWAIERIREAFEKVAKYEAGSLTIAQGIVLKSADFLRRVIEPAGGQGGVTLLYLCPHCNCSPLEDYIWWVSTSKGDSNNKKDRSAAVGGVQSVEKNMNGKHPTGYWWYEQVSVPARQRFFKRKRHRKVCVKT